MADIYHLPVLQARPLTDRVLQVFLQLPVPLHYLAGQYLEVITQTEKVIPLSIANAPLGSSQLELHIGHTPQNSLVNELLKVLQEKRVLTVRAPFGNCTYLSLKPDLPVILLAGGSGFAPIKAIIEQLLALGEPPAIHLYWGAKTLGDLYLDELPKSWAVHVENFRYTSVLSQEISKTWSDRRGTPVDAVLEDYPDLSGYQVLAAGPFDMVFAAKERFLKQSLNPQHIFSDAFTFIP